MNEHPWEDNLVERKVESDLKDVLKTLVAFANSVKPGHIATLFIGEKDDGTIAGVTNPDNIQKKIREDCEKIYPDILWRSTVYEKEGKQCIRVEIEYSGETPHFAGPAWIRKGSTTVKASDEQFQRLIDLRSDIVTELSKWINKEVTVEGDQASVPPNRKQEVFQRMTYVFSHRWSGLEICKIISVNKFWVTFETVEKGEKKSEPIEKLTLTFDDKLNQLKIIVYY